MINIASDAFDFLGLFGSFDILLSMLALEWDKINLCVRAHEAQSKEELAEEGEKGWEEVE